MGNIPLIGRWLMFGLLAVAALSTWAWLLWTIVGRIPAMLVWR